MLAKKMDSSIIKFSIIFLSLFALSLPTIGLAQTETTFIRIENLRLPPFVQVQAPGFAIESGEATGQYTGYLDEKTTFPINLTITGLFGGIVKKQIPSLSQLSSLKVGSGIISSAETNPNEVEHLPSLCPRVYVDHKKPFPSEPELVSQENFLYATNEDRLNHRPIFQLLDPDAKEGEQYKAYAEMDGKNTLLLLKVALTYDYEDSEIVDYDGPHHQTSKPHKIFEGDGGFYANFHYAVVPFSKKYLELDRQTLLHLVQGKLKEINKESLRPKLRTHSLIPGPFLSRSEYIYDMCEWGDTTYQAQRQTLTYRNFALWDWDYSVRSADHVLLIIWEGDEEKWMVDQGLIDPTYLTDDLVGIFEMKRKDTLEPLTLINKRGDFVVTVQTGDISILDL